MNVKRRKYLSYLLRLWKVDQNGIPIWHASLEDPRTGKRRGFVSLKVLLDFLGEQIHESDENDLCEGGSRRNDTSNP